MFQLAHCVNSWSHLQLSYVIIILTCWNNVRNGCSFVIWFFYSENSRFLWNSLYLVFVLLKVRSTSDTIIVLSCLCSYCYFYVVLLLLYHFTNDIRQWMNESVFNNYFDFVSWEITQQLHTVPTLALHNLLTDILISMRSDITNKQPRPHDLSLFLLLDEWFVDENLDN